MGELVEPVRSLEVNARVDLTGKVFGRLTVIGFARRNASRGAMWKCLCECGKSTVVLGYSMRVGTSKSCGCYHKQRVSETFSRPLLDRFMEKVDKQDCWLWTGAIDEETGYGKIGINTTDIEGAHRVSYRLFRGIIPHGLDVCHKCNVRHCVNPDHLYAGTRKENMQQAVREGRLNGRRTKASHP